VKGWTVVFEGARWEADMVMAVLEAKGIRVETLGGMGEYLATNFYDSVVYVPDPEAGQAKAVLAALD